MKIFYRLILVIAITTTAFFVWGNRSIRFFGEAKKVIDQTEKQEKAKGTRHKAFRQSVNDSVPASTYRTTGTPALSAVKAVDKTTASPGDTLTYTISVRNNGDDAANDLSVTDNVDENTTAIPDSLWYSPIAMEDTFTSIGNVGITVPAENGVLLNDQKGSPVATLEPFTRTTSNGGTVTLHADGSFDYTPAAGFSGTDTIQYLLSNRVGTDVGVINISITDVVWFIDNNSGESTADGRLASPFKSVSAFQSVNNGVGNNPKAGHSIFLFESGTAYNGSFTLLNGQKLIGQDATSSIAEITGLYLPPFSKPLPALASANATAVTITSPANAITLTGGGTHYSIRGLSIGNKTGVGISGNNFSNLSLAEVNISGTGQALSLSNGTITTPAGLSTNMGTLSSTSGAYGVSLNGVSGSLVVAPGNSAISGSTTTAFYVAGGSITLSYPGSIAGTKPVDIRNTTASNITLSGNISAANQGISVSGNTNSTIHFSGSSKTLTTGANTAVDISNNTGSSIGFTGGGLVISTTVGDGFKATGAAASLTVSGTGNTITVSGPSAFNGGTALHVNGTTIGASGLTFQSIASSNAQKGIYLANTGAAGGLTVTGTGTLFSGGTIQNSALAGIEISNAYHLNLTQVRLLNANQSQTAPGGFVVADLQGNSLLQNCSFTDAGVRNGYLLHSAGTLTLRVKDSDFGFSTPTVANDLRQDCFEMRTKNTATATVILANSQFRRAGTKGIQLFAENSSTMIASVANCTVDREGGQMAGVEVGSTQSGTMKANIDGNPVINATNEVAINVYAGGTASSRTEATVRNNVSVSGAGDVNSFTDPVVQAFATSDAKGIVLIQNNTITNPDGQAVLTRATEGSGTMDATIRNNNITIPANGFDGIEIRSGADFTSTSNRNCSYVLDNTVANNSTQGGHAFFVQPATPGTTVQLQQKNGANVSDVAALWTTNTNTGSNVDFYTESGAHLQIGTQYVCVTPGNLTAPVLAPQISADTASVMGIATTGKIQQADSVAVTGKIPESNSGYPANAKMNGSLSGETVTVTGVTLPAGKKLVVQFKASVNTPFPVNVCTVSNQAQVSGSNFTAIQSNTVVTNITVKPLITACQENITVSSGACTSTQSFAITATGCPAPTYTYYLVSTGDEITSPYAFPVGTTTVKAKASNAAGADSCTFTVTVTGTNATWTGTTSNDWNTASNWSCGVVPDVNTDVTINSGAAFMPILNTDGGAKNISLGAGASLTINSSATFDVRGDFTSAGIITANGTVSFSGTGNQMVPSATFHHLVISGGGDKSLSGNVSINGTLNFTGGTLSIGNHHLTFEASGNSSGANATSFIVTNGSGVVKKTGLGSGGTTGDFVFPVGISASSYTPATISNAGALDNFTLQVINNVYPDYNGTVPMGSPISNSVVGKTWFVSEENPGGSYVTLTLQWNESDELPGFSRLLSYVSHNTGTAWLMGPTAAAAAGTETSSYTRTLTGITNFSPFGVGSSGSALPVHLLSFKGYPQGTANRLEWTATNEQLQRYEVERSGSQTGFVKIGEVKATGGTGVLSYNWQDPSPVRGANFYRLRLIHPDGRATYSTVVNISRETGTPVVNIYPTPVRDNKLHLQLTNLESGTYKITLYNSAGQAVFAGSVVHPGGSSVERLQLPGTITKGAYVLQITKGDQRFTSNVLIQ